MANATDKKLTQNEFDELSGAMELDLLALFKTWQEESFKLLDEAEEKGWTDGEFIKELDKLKE